MKNKVSDLIRSLNAVLEIDPKAFTVIERLSLQKNTGFFLLLS